MTQVQRPGAETEAILWRAWLGRSGRRPFFAFLHLYEPHSPYEPPEPFRSAYAEPYDGEIAAADAVVGRVPREAEGSWASTTGASIVFLSDHGEGLGDHGEDEHGIFLYREAIQVPLLVKLPGERRAGHDGRGAGGARPTSSRRSATRSAPEGCPVRPGHVSLARPCARRARRPAPDLRRDASTRGSASAGASSPRSPTNWHYIEAPRAGALRPRRGPGRNGRTSPPRSPVRSGRCGSSSETRRRRSGRRPGRRRAREEARVARLHGTATSPRRGALPDPKDVIASLEPLREGMAALQAGRFADAVQLLSGLLDVNPRVGGRLGALRAGPPRAGPERGGGRGRPQENRRAVSGHCDAAAAVGGEPLPADRPGRRSGPECPARPRARRRGRRRGAGASPPFPRRPRGGRSHRAPGGRIRRRPGAGPSWSLHRVQVARGELAQALATTDTAAGPAGDSGGKAPSPLFGLHSLRGEIYARMDRPKDAEAEFREEVRIFPRHPSRPAWASPSSP